MGAARIVPPRDLPVITFGWYSAVLRPWRVNVHRGQNVHMSALLRRVTSDGRIYPPTWPNMPPAERERLRGLAHLLHCGRGLSIRAVQRAMAGRGIRRSTGQIHKDLTRYECDRCAQRPPAPQPARPRHRSRQPGRSRCRSHGADRPGRGPDDAPGQPGARAARPAQTPEGADLQLAACLRTEQQAKAALMDLLDSVLVGNGPG